LNKTLPIQNYYSAKNKYFGVEGIGEIEQIFESLCDHLDKIS
jgi:adenylate kinase